MSDSKNSKDGKGVTFHATAKTHDGLCLVLRVLDDMLEAYFGKQCLCSAKDLHDFLKACVPSKDWKRVLSRLADALANMVLKLDQGDMRTCIPVLLQGGGRGHKVEQVHRHHLARLEHWLRQLLI